MLYCLEPGLNQRPLDLQSNALPAELSRQYAFLENFGNLNNFDQNIDKIKQQSETTDKEISKHKECTNKISKEIEDKENNECIIDTCIKNKGINDKCERLYTGKSKWMALEPKAGTKALRRGDQSKWEEARYDMTNLLLKLHY